MVLFAIAIAINAKIAGCNFLLENKFKDLALELFSSYVNAAILRSYLYYYTHASIKFPLCKHISVKAGGTAVAL